MKYIFAFLLCLFCSSTFAADEVVTLFLNRIESQIQRIDDPTYYAGKVFVDKNTKEKIKFESFSETEKKMFYLWQAEVVSKKLLAFEYSLQGSLDKEIKALRIKMAARQEELIAKTFSEIGDDIVPKNDKMNHLKQVQKWNDEHGLIKRTP